MTVFEQDGYDLRVEWGLDGVRALGPHCAVLVFTTTVDAAPGRGGRVLPLTWRDERAAEAAEAALTPPGLDESIGHAGWSLRPSIAGRVVPVLTDGVYAA
ncbi:MAG: hypothetical protein WBA97_37410 [Actinophytocola sp.]|uniref:hypothetical protein n=1 Tax=Actinophytocola sp. TaxID=1872138 RepID=UPI003C764152